MTAGEGQREPKDDRDATEGNSPSGPAQTQDAAESPEAAEQRGAEPLSVSIPPPSDASVTIGVDEYDRLCNVAAERDRYMERFQRAVADYRNLQKRIQRAQETASLEAMRKVSVKLMPLADILTHAIEAAERTAGAEALVEGLKHFESDFYGVLKAFGLEPIRAAGHPFDPTYHEAVLRQETMEAPPNTVLQEVKRGFTLGGQVVRAAQVIVAARR